MKHTPSYVPRFRTIVQTGTFTCHQEHLAEITETRFIWEKLARFARYQSWTVVAVNTAEKLEIKCVKSRPVRHGIGDNDWPSRVGIMFFKQLSTELGHLVYLCQAATDSAVHGWTEQWYQYRINRHQAVFRRQILQSNQTGVVHTFVPPKMDKNPAARLRFWRHKGAAKIWTLKMCKLLYL